MPLPVGFINDCAELVESERGYIVEYAVIAYEVTAIGILLCKFAFVQLSVFCGL